MITMFISYWFSVTQASSMGTGRAGREYFIACTTGARHTVLMLADEQASPEQIEALQRLTPEQRWQAAHRLYWTMRRHKAAFLRTQHPDWSEEQIQQEVR